MDFKKLEQNINDIITEEHLKLGYRHEKIRLYYPLRSLNRLLGTDGDTAQMSSTLSLFCDAMRETYGSIKISVQNQRFCLLIPPEGNEYIHQHSSDHAFLEELIHTVSRHGCLLEDVLSLFHRYSDHVHMEKTEHGEFDYLLYFEDGIPDSFFYCLSVEAHHVTYHRFTREDYQDLEL